MYFENCKALNEIPPKEKQNDQKKKKKKKSKQYAISCCSTLLSLCKKISLRKARKCFSKYLIHDYIQD